MSADKETLLKLLTEARENVRKKYTELRRGEADSLTRVKRQLAPIIEPLDKIASQQQQQQQKQQQQQEQLQQTIKSLNDDIYTVEHDDGFFHQYMYQWSMNPNRDKMYGPKVSPDGTMTLGEADNIFLDRGTINVLDEKFPLTMGLVDLLFSKNPGVYSESDLHAYKTILGKTGVHLNKDGTLKKGGQKYVNTIKPLFDNGYGGNPNNSLPLFESSSSNISDTSIIGAGLQLRLNNKKKDYVYWDDPNELVERLRLLISARSAGNTGVSPEIVSILEELQEAGYIEQIPAAL